MTAEVYATFCTTLLREQFNKFQFKDFPSNVQGLSRTKALF